MNTYNYDSFGTCDVGGPGFWKIANVGSPAPDFSLPDLDGNTVSLSSFKGKKSNLLEFGSIT
jgi:peroxiredoxin